MRNAKILVVLAHPDDADFSSGGSVAKWIKQDCEVHYVLVTSGDKGNHDPNRTGEEMKAIRRVEQKEAAKVLGVQHLTFLEETDGEVENNADLRRKISRVIRHFKPDLLVTHDPWVRYRGHPDHYAVGFACCVGGVLAAGNRMYFPELLQEGLQPHQVPEVLLTGSEEADYQEDVSETFDLKLKAAKKHASQIRNEEAMVGRFTARAQTIGAKIGVPLAEEFKRIRLFG